MSGEIIDISAALEERQFKAKEDRIDKMREAFRAARLGASGEAKSKTATLKDVKRKKKSRKTKR
tara:strand:- start:1278 stop:1469 length:192 start_codon:yes stop_codon:yes gene_type:complete